MNCPCCSAPLQGGGPDCRYCGSRLDLDLQGWRQLRSDGPNLRLQCPEGHGELESLALDGAEPLELGRCPTCLGLFLPLGALEQLVEREGRSALQIDHRLIQALTETPRAVPAPLRYRSCPSCGVLMNRRLHGKRSGVVVDRCRDHGLWLDAGELLQLLEWAKAGGALLDLEHRRTEAEQASRHQKHERQELQRFLADSDAEQGRSWLDSLARDDLGTLLLRLARRLG